jgi:hypothetical protein
VPWLRRSHYHILLVPRDAEHVADFMEHVDVGRLHGWEGAPDPRRPGSTAVQNNPGLRVRTLETAGQMALFGQNQRESGSRSLYLRIPAVQGIDVQHAAWGLSGAQRPLEAAKTV